TLALPGSDVRFRYGNPDRCNTSPNFWELPVYHLRTVLGRGPVLCRRYQAGRTSCPQGEVLHNDDTSMRVLHVAREPSDDRTGVFTNGIASTQQGQRIALYFTGRQHAGENPRDVLEHRTRGLARLCR